MADEGGSSCGGSCCSRPQCPHEPIIYPFDVVTLEKFHRFDSRHVRCSCGPFGEKTISIPRYMAQTFPYDQDGMVEAGKIFVGHTMYDNTGSEICLLAIKEDADNVN